LSSIAAHNGIQIKKKPANKFLTLENAIMRRPESSRVLVEKSGYRIYEKSTFPKLYDKLMYTKTTITICYAVHIQSGHIVFENIW